MAQPVDNVESRLDKLNKQSRQRIRDSVGQSTFAPRTVVVQSDQFDAAMQEILDKSNRVPQPDKRK